MYLNKKLIKGLKIKNVLFIAFAVVEFLVSGYYIVSIFARYSDDLETAWGAKDMKLSIVMVCVAAVVLAIALVSIKHIDNAVFYSSYFEGDLDGYTKYSDLAKVVGKSESSVRRQLHFYRGIYMTDFKFTDKSGTEVVELYSKKSLCECRSCGAHIEKRVYFTGECPYCHSSDLHAKVLSGDHFFSISNQLDSGSGKPEFYKAPGLNAKRVLYFALLILGTTLAVIALMMTLSEAGHYFDKEYQKKILLDPTKHLFSYELIKAHIMDMILFGAGLFVIFTPLAVLRWRKTMALFSAMDWAEYFSHASKPFINADSLPDLGFASGGKRKIKRMRLAIRKGYLKNCTLEVHDGVLVAALAKKTVKDRCLTCGAPLVNAVDEDSRCSYCGNLIMGVLEKK